MTDATERVARGGRAQEQRGELGELGLWLAVLVVAGFIGLSSPLLGAIADGLILVWLSVIVRSGMRWADAATGLALIPLLRLLWLVMPVDGITMLDWAPLVAIPFLAAALLAARAVNLTPGEIGLKVPTGIVLPVLAVGAWAAAGALLAIVAGDAVAWGLTATGVSWERVVVYALLIAVAEEVAFRGVLPGVLERAAPGLGMWAATGACAMLCLGAASPWWVGIALGVAGLNAVLTVRTGSLAPAIVGHVVFLVALNL